MRSRLGPQPIKVDVRANTWPRWATTCATLGIILHVAALVSAELSPSPSSRLERRVNSVFLTYLNFINNNYSHRFYAKLDSTADAKNPKRWGTPVATAELEFGESEPATVRIPQPGAWPRLRYQRHLALAQHLAAQPRWGASYARHLCRMTGSTRVRLFIQQHTIPELTEARRLAAAHGSARNASDPSAYSDRVLIGDFRWGEF